MNRVVLKTMIMIKTMTDEINDLHILITDKEAMRCCHAVLDEAVFRANGSTWNYLSEHKVEHVNFIFASFRVHVLCLMCWSLNDITF